MRKATKSLSLNKETVRRLGRDELGQAAGGLEKPPYSYPFCSERCHSGDPARCSTIGYCYPKY